MAQQPHIMKSPLTERYYAVTRYTDLGDGKFIAKEKFDITADIQKLEAAAVQAALSRVSDNLQEFSDRLREGKESVHDD